MTAAVALLLYMPFTYSGGGGPIGNRYYMPFYALFFATPPLRSVWPALVAAVQGAPTACAPVRAMTGGG